MIIHNVYFWLKDELTADDLAAFEAGLNVLCTETTAAKGHYGKPAATPVRPVTDKSFSYNLMLVFESMATHDEYQACKVHQDFIATHKDKWATLKVYDTEVL